MRTVNRYSVSLTVVTAIVVSSGAGMAQTNQDRPLVSQAQYDQWLIYLSNWGRWGEDDEIGALNLINPQKRRAAARLVTEGFSVSLASTAQTEATVDNPCPINWEMVTASPGGASDRVAYPCIHGPGTTHIDGFAHRFFDGKMWNGVPIADTVTMESGASRNSILTMKHGIVTRGVLYDIPRLRGHDYVDPSQPVQGWDLQDWASKVGVEPRDGDAVLIRSGSDSFWAANPTFEFSFPPNTPGNAPSIIEYLYDTNAALLGWDLQEAGHRAHEYLSLIHI